MKTTFTTMRNYQSYLLGLLRIVTGYMYFIHGCQKIFGVPAGNHVTDLASMMGLAGILELTIGFCILIGFQTRLFAFLGAGMMAVAYFTAHAGMDNFWLPLVNKGEAAVLYCFVYLYLWSAGSGAWSVDNALTKSDTLATPRIVK